MPLLQVQPLACQSRQIWYIGENVGMGSSPWESCFLALGLSFPSLARGGWID